MNQDINKSAMLPEGTIIHGVYRIDSYLSSGGFGNTYVATNIEFDERYAIKVFFMKGVTQREGDQTTVSVSNAENESSFQQQKEKFKKEARRLRQFDNQHIIRVHDLFEENGTAYYVMDYIDGENLAEHLQRTCQTMTEAEVNLILPQILDALKTIHDAGIWHLDLKPANIMIDKRGSIKLIDFGASKQFNPMSGGATTDTVVSYTMGYAPREQMEQSYDKFGPWTDFYALGATIYALLTNKKPPKPSDIDDDISADKHLALPLPSNISVRIKQLILWLLRTNRSARPQSVNEIYNNLIELPVSTVKSNPEETIIEKKIEKPNSEGLSHWVGFLKLYKYDVIGSLLLIMLFMIWGLYNSANKDETSSVSLSERFIFETPIGKCQYEGNLDEENRPNGKGEAHFYDGRYYKGFFEHGNLTGKDAYFEYGNGDKFTGEFRNNLFYYGTYTIAEDGSYYVGYYKNGKPQNGTWYDKRGKVIQ